MSYQDKFYSKYSSTHAQSLYGRLTKKDIYDQFGTLGSYFGTFLPKDKNAEILDIGSGSGGFVSWLQYLGYSRAEGIDISEEQVQVAKELEINNIHQADALEFLPINKNKFDVVFARDLLEHLPKEQVLLIIESIFASLKPEGIFVAQTVNAENWLWGRLRHGDFTHEVAFTHSSIRQILKVFEFKEIKVFPQRPIVHGFISLIRYIIWITHEALTRGLLIAETGSGRGIFTQNLIVCAKK